MFTGTYVRTYFRQFVASLRKKFHYYVLFYQELEPAPGKNSGSRLKVENSWSQSRPKTGRLRNPGLFLLVDEMPVHKCL